MILLLNVRTASKFECVTVPSRADLVIILEVRLYKVCYSHACWLDTNPPRHPHANMAESFPKMEQTISKPSFGISQEIFYLLKLNNRNYSLLCEGNFRYDFLMSSCVLNRIRGAISESHLALRVVTSFFCPKTSYLALPK